MPRKAKASAEEKVQIVEAYLRGEMGLKSAAAKLSVVISTMELWIALYRAEGSNAFVQAKRNRCYIYHTAKLAFCRQLGINIDSRLEGRGAVFASHTRPFPLRHKSTNALQQRHAELLI